MDNKGLSQDYLIETLTGYGDIYMHVVLRDRLIDSVWYSLNQV